MSFNADTFLLQDESRLSHGEKFTDAVSALSGFDQVRFMPIKKKDQTYDIFL